jgi:hypothetical protein
MITSENVEVEDADSFQQGVLVGQQAAIDGLEIVPDPCVDLNKEPPAILDFSASGFEALVMRKEIIKGAFGGALFSGVLLLADLSVALETHFDNPGEALQARAAALQSLLTEMGIADSMELFLGGGVEFDKTGCELKLTPVFRSLESARSAAQAIGRRGRLVVSWLAHRPVRRDAASGLRRVITLGGQPGSSRAEKCRVSSKN